MAGRPFSFVVLGDLHVSRPLPDDAPEIARRFLELTPPEELRRFLEELPERVPDAELVITLGDLTNRGLPEEFERLLDAMHASPVPVVLLPGNHDHMNGAHDSITSRNGEVINTGDPAGFVDRVGPRWFSFDHEGLHFAAIDWHTWELGLDDGEQEAWLAADVAALDDTTPWVLLSHDQMPARFFDPLTRQPVAAFSGHWHTTRVMRVNGTLHCNTPTPFFGGLDYTPPAFRVVTWDGRSCSLLTLTRVPGAQEHATFRMGGASVSGRDSVRWDVSLDGAVHRAAPVVDGERVLVASKCEDDARGALEVFRTDDGGLVARVGLTAAIKARPLVAGDVVVVVGVAGDVVALDRETLDERWRFDVPEPLTQWVYLAPISDGTNVLTGDQSCLRAVDLRTGSLRWERRDLGPRVNFAVAGTPALVGDTLVVGFFPLAVQGLDAATGESRWNHSKPGRDPIAGGMLAPAALGSIVAGADGEVYIHAIPGVERLDGRTGEVAWVAATPGVFNPAAPVVTPSGVVVACADGDVILLDPASGAVRWSVSVGGTAPFAFAPYTAVPHPLLAEPTVVGDVVVLPGLDGVVRTLDLTDGALRREVDLGSPIAAPVAVTDELVIAATVGGHLVAVEREALGLG